MPERYYPAPLPQYGLEQGPILLKDGRTALLRPATPADRPLLVELLSRLSPQARSFRFFSEVSPETGADLLLKQTPGEDKVALLVLTGEPPRVIATGEYVQEGPGADSAEVAFLVDDWFQGKGLGTLLLERLALIAARRGIRRFHAFTLAENRQMLEVFRSSGFNVKTESESGEVEVEFEIEPNATMVERFELRERIATIASLQPFFRPRGVAVVGASRDPQSVGYRVLENLVGNRFDGPVYPVNPAASHAAGEVLVVGSILAYPSVKAIPGPVDLAVITVPPDQVISAAEACGQRGVRALIVITVGLSEREIQSLGEVCQRYGMRLVGPGSLGMVHTHPEVRLAAGLAEMPPRGRLALSSQSGALGLAVLEYAREMGLGISSFVSLGAKADVSSNDLIQFWEDDPETGVILLYIENFGNPRRFARLARRVGRQKPILVVRPGRDPRVEALFRQTGVIRADSLEEVFDTAALLTFQPLPAGPRVALVSNASGPGSLALEALRSSGLEATHFDLGSAATPLQYRETAAKVLADPAYDCAMALFVPMGFTSAEAVAEALRQALAEARAAGLNKTVLACFMTGGRPRVFVGNERVPVYRFPESAARALSLAVQYARWRMEPPGEIPDFAPREELARELVRQAGKGKLNPAMAQSLLQAFGIPAPQPSPADAPPTARLNLELSVRCDPLFGPVLSLELVDLPLGPQLLDTRITPLTDKDAREMLRALEGHADLSALQELLLRVSRLVEELPEVGEIRLKLGAKENGYRLEKAEVVLG
ncbi:MULTISPECIES: GNAT family N-acetyltransferase [unclassified Meiothermus]|uniref:bifunctional acetate--CoA ligase family protein/GNAT family N-acetyltransferase n=1 Tax=unclassified Meiothermus TaxID=370471 RepID=UPI000D7CAB12|nr:MULTISPECIES: GNAT family N-acetyltransferase [unclassified Meiothermus]PZA06151.1 6-carboxyhexanoate--CoA ligase [Meiothermus sp. Pnk-1]RYM36209.1 GNAT family N-acetyltransferase [Meiothermus sp. PNK-Is4]